MSKIKTKEDLLSALSDYGSKRNLPPNPEEGEFTTKDYQSANGISESHARRAIRKGIEEGTIVRVRIYLPGDCSRTPIYRLK